MVSQNRTKNRITNDTFDMVKRGNQTKGSKNNFIVVSDKKIITSGIKDLYFKVLHTMQCCVVLYIKNYKLALFPGAAVTFELITQRGWHFINYEGRAGDGTRVFK